MFRADECKSKFKVLRNIVQAGVYELRVYIIMNVFTILQRWRYSVNHLVSLFKSWNLVLSNFFSTRLRFL